MSLFGRFLPRGWRLALVSALAALLPVEARATPLDDPHVGGIGFSGPTATDLSAIYWNPAALGLIGGHQLMAGGTARLGAVSVERAPIDPATGRPGGPRTFPRSDGRADLHPLHWPLGPGAFLGAAASLGSRFTLGFAAYTPFAQRQTFSVPSSGGSAPATRYHAVSTDLRNLALAPALSIRLGGGLRIGAAPGFLFSVGRLTVDEDTGLGAACAGQPCGAENPEAAARYDVSSGMALFDSSVSFTLGLGIHLERGRWSLGLAYLTRPLGTEDGIELQGKDTRITLPAVAGPDAAANLCPPELRGAQRCVSGHAVYRLPDSVVGGLDYRLDGRFTLGLMLRWLDTSSHDAFRLRVVGPASGSLRAAGLEQELVLFRGLRDVLDARLRLLARLGPRLELAAALRVETPAAPAAALSPGFVDGWDVEPALAVRARLASWLQLAAGYALSYTPAVEVNDSVFSPTAPVDCAAAGGDLRAPSCLARAAGQARPTAAGTYRAHTHAFGLTLTVRL